MTKPREIVLPIVVPRSEICRVSWTFDGYDGVAVLRTDCAEEGRCSLLLSDSMFDEAMEIIESLRDEGVPIEVLENFYGE